MYEVEDDENVMKVFGKGIVSSTIQQEAIE